MTISNIGGSLVRTISSEQTRLFAFHNDLFMVGSLEEMRGIEPGNCVVVEYTDVEPAELVSMAAVFRELSLGFVVACRAGDQLPVEVTSYLTNGA